MRIVTIGTGCARPNLKRGGNSILVQCGGVNIVVDLGLGSLHGLLREGLSHADVDLVVLTHFHTDHTAELASFLFAANYDETPRDTPLALAGGEGLGRFVDALGGLYGNWMAARGYARRLAELKPGDALNAGPVLLEAGPASHDPSSVSWRLTFGGASVVITGDTGPDEGLTSFASGADILVAEASLPHDRPAPYHLRAEDAAALAKKAKVGKLVLTHFYPASEADHPLERAKAVFDGPVALAEDGAEYILSGAH